MNHHWQSHLLITQELISLESVTQNFTTVCYAALETPSFHYKSSHSFLLSLFIVRLDGFILPITLILISLIPLLVRIIPPFFHVPQINDF